MTISSSVGCKLVDPAAQLGRVRAAVIRTRALLAFCMGVLIAAQPASAALLQISGTGFVRHCPCAGEPGDTALVENGVLKPQSSNTTYFAPLPFLTNGQRFCSFSLVYRDVNGTESITGSLRRKGYVVGGNAANAPAVLASVTTAPGVVDTVRRVTDTTINNPVINLSGFYYVQLDVDNINLEVLGVQIDVRPTCP